MSAMERAQSKMRNADASGAEATFRYSGHGSITQISDIHMRFPSYMKGISCANIMVNRLDDEFCLPRAAK